MHADTPNKTSGEAPARAAGTAPGPAPAASQGFVAPAEAEAGTYAAIATPFEGGSHPILTPTPSISGDPSAALGPASGQISAVTHRPAALQTAEVAQQVKLQALL